MVGWWLILFGLSVMTFVDTFFGVGATFREITSAGLLLSMLGLLTRIARKTRKGAREELLARVEQLERELESSRAEQVTRPKHKQTGEQLPTAV
jgi:hypothetical protein